MPETYRQKFLKAYTLEDKPYSLKQLSDISKVPKKILQEVYNRGIGAYSSQGESVRLKNSFVKNVKAPMSDKLSKENWAYARVYSFLMGNKKHDNDLRANKGAGKKGGAKNPKDAREEMLKALSFVPIDDADDEVAELLGMLELGGDDGMGSSSNAKQHSPPHSNAREQGASVSLEKQMEKGKVSPPKVPTVPKPPKAESPPKKADKRKRLETVKEEEEAETMGSLNGEGIFSDLKDKLGVYVNRAKTVFTKGLREGLPPKARSTLEKYGDWYIMDIKVRRDAIQSLLNSALNLITMGKWNEARAKYQYDKLFHLGIVVRVSQGGQSKNILIEKNEVIYIGETKKDDTDTEYENVPLGSLHITLREFIEKGAQAKGRDFYLYDAFKNNCQDFVMTLLKASGLASSQVSTFVKQPVDELVKDLPGYTGKIAKGATDIAGALNYVIEGDGYKHGGALCKSCGMYKQRALVGKGISEDYIYTPSPFIPPSMEFGSDGKRLTEEQKAVRAKRNAEQVRLRAAREKLFKENPAVLQAAIEQEKRLRSPEYKAEEAAKREKENVARKADFEGFQARQQKVKDYNEEMRRRRDSPMGKILQGLTDVADFGVKYIAPVVGVPSVVTDIYKSFAPPTSEFYQGGGPMGSSVRRINRGKKGQMLPLAVDVATAIGENIRNPVGLISSLTDVMKQGSGKKDIIMMSKKSFVKEHKKLIGLLDKLTKERNEQAKELKERTGGKLYCGMKNKRLPQGDRFGTRLECFKKGVGVGMNMEKPLDKMSLRELGAVASKLKISNYGKMKKAELLEAIQAKRGGAKKKEIIFRSLEESDAKGKKWRVNLSVNGKHKVINFGAKGMEDYTTLHKDNKRKELYLERHREREDWNNPLTAGFWSRWLLWNKKSLNASLSDVRKRFKI